MQKDYLKKFVISGQRVKKVKFLITCGGFIQFDWPKSISKKDIGDTRNPHPSVINILVEKAKEDIEKVLTKDLRNRLREVTDYITFGVDSHKKKISTTQNYINQPHIELVFLVDLRNNIFYWAGKSYPTPRQ